MSIAGFARWNERTIVHQNLHILMVKYNQQDKVYTGANALKDEDLDGSQIVQKCKDFFDTEVWVLKPIPNA